MANQDWDIYRHLDKSLLGFVISSLPYFWIILAIFSLIIAVLNVEHSRKGYKYSPLKIIIVSILLAISLGFAGYALGFGKKIDNYIGSKFRSYQSVEIQKKLVWNQPDKGLFSGTIESVNKENTTFDLKDFSGKEWQVDYSMATLKGGARVEENSEVKIIGKKTGVFNYFQIYIFQESTADTT